MPKIDKQLRFNKIVIEFLLELSKDQDNFKVIIKDLKQKLNVKTKVV